MPPPPRFLEGDLRLKISEPHLIVYTRLGGSGQQTCPHLQRDRASTCHISKYCLRARDRDALRDEEGPPAAQLHPRRDQLLCVEEAKHMHLQPESINILANAKAAYSPGNNHRTRSLAHTSIPFCPISTMADAQPGYSESKHVLGPASRISLL